MPCLVFIDGFCHEDSSLKSIFKTMYGKKELFFVFLPGICEVLNAPALPWWKILLGVDTLFQQIEIIYKNILFFQENEKVEKIIFVKMSPNSGNYTQYLKNSVEILLIKRPDLNFSYETYCFQERFASGRFTRLSFDNDDNTKKDVLSVVTIDPVMTKKYYQKICKKIWNKSISRSMNND